MPGGRPCRLPEILLAKRPRASRASPGAIRTKLSRLLDPGSGKQQIAAGEGGSATAATPAAKVHWAATISGIRGVRRRARQGRSRRYEFMVRSRQAPPNCGQISALVDRALAGDPPMLAINPLETESEGSEQRGFANLVRGTFGVFRNTTAHEARIHWHIGKEDAEYLRSPPLPHASRGPAPRRGPNRPTRESQACPLRQPPAAGGTRLSRAQEGAAGLPVAILRSSP